MSDDNKPATQFPAFRDEGAVSRTRAGTQSWPNGWREQRDQNALHQLTSAHMRLVIAIAARFRNYGLPMQDMIQERPCRTARSRIAFRAGTGSAVSRLMPPGGYGPPSRITSCGTGRSCGAEHSSAQKALFFNLRRLRAKLSRNGDERMSESVYAEIAEAIGVSKKDVATMDVRLSGADTLSQCPHCRWREQRVRAHGFPR